MKHQTAIVVFMACLTLISGCRKGDGSDSTTPVIEAKPVTYPINLTGSGYVWQPATDEFGSSCDTGSALRTDSVVTVSFTLAQKTDDEKWPYIELIASLGGTMQSVDTVILEYRCTEPLVIKLSQSDFGSKGNETYSHYQFTADSASDWKQAVIPVSSFAKPDWTPEISKEIPYKPENVDAIYFTPAVDYQTGGTAALSIRALYLR